MKTQVLDEALKMACLQITKKNDNWDGDQVEADRLYRSFIKRAKKKIKKEGKPNV